MGLNRNIQVQNNINIEKHSEVIEKIFVCVNDHLTVLMTRMLNSADDIFFDLAEKATSNEEQMKYMDCTRIFRTERNDISQLFFINLNKSLSPNAPVADNIDTTNSGELSLIDQDEMEELVAISTMHAKAMNLYGQEVHNLEARLEYLEIYCENMFDKEALDPKHICEVFQKTTENLDVAIEVKLIFYKLFDQMICSKLGIMYKTINQIFIQNGIMPKVILSTTKNEEVAYEDNDDDYDQYEDLVSPSVASCYNPNNKAYSQGASGSVSGDSVSDNLASQAKDNISGIVNQFLSGEMSIGGGEIHLPESFARAVTKHNVDGKGCYDKNEVLRALSKLQSTISSLKKTASKDEPEEILTTKQIKQELINNISEENGGVIDKQVGLLDERNMDFVGLMFDAITDDETVSEIMTNLITQLQIPVMKVAITDNNLYEQEDHPARITVDLLTSTGKGINHKEDRLYDELEEIVDSILDDFDVDLDAFEVAVDVLNNVVQREDWLTNETERLQQKKILQEHAKKVVVSQLRFVLNQKVIPNNIRPLVLKNWSTLMLNRYIRYGRSSMEWMQSVLLLKLLLKCMQPMRFQSQYDLMETNHEALVEAVNDELYETKQDKTDISSHIIPLKDYFLEAINSHGFKISDHGEMTLTEEELVTSSTTDVEEELQSIQKQTDVAKNKIAQLDGNTRPGVWYEIYNGENKPVRRLKLSVILTDAAQLIFVDRKGTKVIEKDAEDFAKELNDKRSRVLADHSTFDNALGKVITALAA